MIRTLRRVSGVLPLTRWLADAATTVVVVIALVVVTCVDDAVHAIFALAVAHFLVDSKTGPAAGTATLALVVAGECVASSKPAAALETRVRAFARVKLRVAFQVVQTPETGLARRTLIRLLLAVRQQVALEVVVPGKVGRAVWAFVALGRG